MTIKVAKDGYDGTSIPGHGLLLIGGVLHQAVAPVHGGPSLWIPVRSYDGPVEHVDTRGRPITPPSMSDAERAARQLAWDLKMPGAKNPAEGAP